MDAKRKLVITAPIIKRLMVENDPEGAIQMVMEQTQGDSSTRIYSVFRNIRNRIMRREENRDKKAYTELCLLASMESTDKDFLQEVLAYPLHKILWAQNTNGLFRDQVMEDRFRKLEFLGSNFKAFKCPTYVSVKNKEETFQSILSSHRHEQKPLKHYNYLQSDVDSMIEWATSMCLNTDLKWSSRSNSLRLLEALCLLTGRRKWELCKTLQIKSCPDSDYKALVWGIQKSFKEGHLKREIPLLAPLNVIVKGLFNLRQYPHKQGSYALPKKYRKFPNCNHTFFRDIYCKQAYKNRAINKFLDGSSCSELFWCSEALGDVLITYVKHYATVVIEQDNESAQHSNNDNNNQDLANPSG
jgi:hypothetical protein